MLLLSVLRLAMRYGLAQRPHGVDMDQIVCYLRRRRERGLPAVPFGRVGRLRGAGQGTSVRWLDALRTRKLRRTVEYVYRYVPFYREAMDAQGVKPLDIRSLADVHRLPITRREQVSQNPEVFISRYPGLVASTMAQTGGTTGRPLQIYLTSEELHYYAAGEAVAGLTEGWLGPTEIVQTHFTMDEAIETIVLTNAAHMAGTLMLTLGTTGTLDEHLESIFRQRQLPGKKPQVSWLMISPSHLWALTRRAEEVGIDCKASGLKRITTGGAMVSEDLKQRVKETWGIRLAEGYGLTETFTCAAGQCSKSDRLHFTDITGYAEALDPQTEEPVPPGQPGVLAITTFYPDRELMPLLRYWTNDLVILAPDRTCVCGQETTQILDIMGRADEMVKIGLWPFYPQEIGDSLLAFPELVMPPRFTLRAEQREDAQYAILDVEQSASLSAEQAEQLCQRIADGIILSRHPQIKLGAVKLAINLRPAGSLERPFTYKPHPAALTRPDR